MHAEVVDVHTPTVRRAGRLGIILCSPAAACKPEPARNEAAHRAGSSMQRMSNLLGYQTHNSGS